MDGATWQDVREVRNGRITRRSTRGRAARDTTFSSRDRPLDNVPTLVKQHSLYVFAKYVAGFAGVVTMDILFDVPELLRASEDIDLMVYSPLLLAAISSTSDYLTVVCSRHGVVSHKWENIVTDPRHSLFEPFARLASYHLRSSIATRPNVITALRQNIANTITMIQEERMFEMSVMKYGGYGVR